MHPSDKYSHCPKRVGKSKESGFHTRSLVLAVPSFSLACTLLSMLGIGMPNWGFSTFDSIPGHKLLSNETQRITSADVI